MSMEAKSKRRTFEVDRRPDDKEGAPLARELAGAQLGSAVIVTDFSEGLFGQVALTAAFEALKSSSTVVASGDLSSVKQMLASQAIALNTIFVEMGRRAALNLTAHPKAAEDRLRMAFRAQNQCRMTLETLANIVNPPTVFARQANITSGPQQVNNDMRTFARVEGGSTPPNELLEQKHGTSDRMDAGAQGKARNRHHELAPLGAVHRAKKQRG